MDEAERSLCLFSREGGEDVARQVYTVTQVNEFVKALLDGAAPLQGLSVRGELSNYKIYPSDHHYFTLKDSGGAIRCVMFASSAGKLRFRPENGMQVVASGRISVYPRDGAYQLAAERLGRYRDYNTAVALCSLGKNHSAKAILEQLESTPKVEYMLAIINSRLGHERAAVQHYVLACEKNPSYLHRGNLDPEISSLIRKYHLETLFQ